jgi:hypothetical protein
MEWIIKIEGKPKQRILVKFDPQKEMIYFIGQYKPDFKTIATVESKSVVWFDFATEEYPMNITLELIQDMLLKVYEKMNERLTIYEDLSKSFEIIKLIEIPEG